MVNGTNKLRPILEKTSITRAAAKQDGTAYFAFVIDNFAFDSDNQHAGIYELRDSKATEWAFLDFSVSGMVFADQSGILVAVGQNGAAAIMDGTNVTIEDVSEDGTIIRGVCEAGKDIIACGVFMSAWRRAGPDDWQEFGPAAEFGDEFPANHLEAVDGYSETEIYAAGRDGVIWWYDGSRWTPVQCPTNLAFTCIVCADDGFVYAAGLTGIVAKGRRDGFELFTPSSPNNDIWGITEFRGNVYCSMMRALVTFSSEDGLTPVPTAMLLADFFYNLERGAEVLWSFGEKDVLTFDGSAWTGINQVDVA